MAEKWTLSELKEIVLSLNALLWAILLFLPGETLSTASRIDLLAVYGGDVVWAAFLLIASLFLLFSPRSSYRSLRRAAHASFWLFWLAMTILLLIRSSENGLQPTDIMVGSPFLTVAFIHAAFYVRLVYVK